MIGHQLVVCGQVRVFLQQWYRQEVIPCEKISRKCRIIFVFFVRSLNLKFENGITVNVFARACIYMLLFAFFHCYLGDG